MSNAGLDKLIWVLIYGGLLLLCLGFFVRPNQTLLGSTFLLLGGLMALLGALLVWVRSRRPR